MSDPTTPGGGTPAEEPVRSVADVLAFHECADPLTGATNFESWSKGTVTF